jgi:hypothetical protein
MMHWHSLLRVLPAYNVSELRVQSWHVADEVAAVAPLYLCRTHSVHAALPKTALNFPATHPSHGPLLGPVNPSLHWHAVFTLLPASDTEFAAHAWQTVDTVALTVGEYVSTPQSVQYAGPINGLNLPAAHPKHGNPFCKGIVWGQNPARHVQFVKAPLPAGDDVYCGQNSH